MFIAQPINYEFIWKYEARVCGTRTGGGFKWEKKGWMVSVEKMGLAGVS